MQSFQLSEATLDVGEERLEVCVAHSWETTICTATVGTDAGKRRTLYTAFQCCRSHSVIHACSADQKTL